MGGGGADPEPGGGQGDGYPGRRGRRSGEQRSGRNKGSRCRSKGTIEKRPSLAALKGLVPVVAETPELLPRSFDKRTKDKNKRPKKVSSVV